MKSIFPLKFIGLANALEIDADGWALIPYGDTRHSGRDARGQAEGKKEVPVIQRFDRASAQALVNDFRSAMGSIKRAVVGLPIFKGHPDAERFAKIWPDKTPRGTIADMQVGERGLRIRPVLTEQGADDVRGGHDEFSPYWLLNRVGEENGTPVVSPFLLKSIGLTPRGNIPGLSLVNADAPDDSDSPMKNHIIKLLAAIGKPVAADADDAAISAAVDAACPFLAAANTAEGQLATLKTEKISVESKLTAAEQARVAAEGEKLALVNAKESLTTEVAGLKTALATERKARAMLIVNAAVTDGRLVPASRDETVTALCNASDFDAMATRLSTAAKTLPTESKAKDLGKDRGPGTARATQVLALVNARMDSDRVDYETAFSRVQSDPKHAEIFAAMQPAK